MEVKEKWRGMESGAKREHSKCVITRKKTGVGNKPDCTKATSAKIIKLLETDLSFNWLTYGNISV